MGHIIAMGGGGFSMELENPALDRYIIAQTGKATPRVCFLAQASGESLDYTVRFYRAYSSLGCQPVHLSLYSCPVVDLAALFAQQDVIFVGGGNTRSMLAVWHEWGLPDLLRAAYARGAVLAGVSAGANCWFEQNITDSVVPELSVLPGLGFLPGSFCPHYDGEAQRRPAYHRFLAEGAILPGYAADDGVAFHFVDGALQRIVSSRPNARGYRLEMVDGQPVETPLTTDLLEGRKE